MQHINCDKIYDDYLLTEKIVTHVIRYILFTFILPITKKNFYMFNQIYIFSFKNTISLLKTVGFYLEKNQFLL